VSHCNNLKPIGQFAVEDAVGKWCNPATADRFLMERPSLRIALNPLFRHADRIQKGLSQSRLLFIVVLGSLGQFNLSDA
jgi:hypothetical protein